MPEDPYVSRLREVAASTASLPDRAQEVVRVLLRWVPFEAAWLALLDPVTREHVVVASSGLDSTALEHLARPATVRDLELAGLDRPRPPASLDDLPIGAHQMASWTDALLPAGFCDGLGVPLFEDGDSHVGFLGLLTTAREPPSALSRERLALVSPVVAAAVSPLRSLLSSARIARGASAGVALLRDGSTSRLPGRDLHPLLVGESPVLALARETLRAGQEYRTFLWPDDVDPTAAHVRVTVLRASDAPDFLMGAVVLTPRASPQGLTVRELEVLGQLVEGRSNQQIAHRLAVAPRTVAAHVEHLLLKLDASSRTLAAVRAERDGLYVPTASSPRRATAAVP